MRRVIMVALVAAYVVLPAVGIVFAQSFDSQDAEVASLDSSLSSEIAGEEADRADEMRDMDEDMQGNEMRVGIGDSY